MSDALPRLRLAAERFEGFALQIEDVLLAYRSARGHVAAAQHLGDFDADLLIVVTDLLGLPHEVYP